MGNEDPRRLQCKQALVTLIAARDDAELGAPPPGWERIDQLLLEIADRPRPDALRDIEAAFKVLVLHAAALESTSALIPCAVFGEQTRCKVACEAFRRNLTKLCTALYTAGYKRGLVAQDSSHKEE